MDSMWYMKKKVPPCFQTVFFSYIKLCIPEEGQWHRPAED